MVMRLFQTIVVLAALAFGSGCGDSDEGYVGHLTKTHRKAREVASIEPARECVKAFQAMNGRYPRDIEELKKEFEDLPDPPDGMKYDYDPKTGRLDLVESE